MADNWSIRRCWLCLMVSCGCKGRPGQRSQPTTVASSGGLHWSSSYPVHGGNQLLQVAQPLEEELCSLVLVQQTAGFFIQQEAVSPIHLQTPAGPPQPWSSILFLLPILLNCLQREENLTFVLVQFYRATEEPQSLNPNERRHSGAEQDGGGGAAVRRRRNK